MLFFVETGGEDPEEENNEWRKTVELPEITSLFRIFPTCLNEEEC